MSGLVDNRGASCTAGVQGGLNRRASNIHTHTILRRLLSNTRGSNKYYDDELHPQKNSSFFFTLVAIKSFVLIYARFMRPLPATSSWRDYPKPTAMGILAAARLLSLVSLRSMRAPKQTPPLLIFYLSLYAFFFSLNKLINKSFLIFKLKVNFCNFA